MWHAATHSAGTPQLPLRAFFIVGAVYYAQLGTVLSRTHRTDDHQMRNRALLVLAGNELWNAAFFGRRSARNGFAGLLVFLRPLLALQKSVASDSPSLLALTPYSLWVIGYDIPWTYALWQLNPDRAGHRRGGSGDADRSRGRSERSDTECARSGVGCATA
jgi:translocator protein